jgi:hypothetical protein|tara:strand:+ start:270 stop:428 length:159 start_codon:yes stop_codon:yes gene_type:complete
MELEFVTLEILEDEDEMEWQPEPLYLELPLENTRQPAKEDEKQPKRVIILDI